jgi:hypothetical protein
MGGKRGTGSAAANFWYIIHIPVTTPPPKQQEQRKSMRPAMMRFLTILGIDSGLLVKGHASRTSTLEKRPTLSPSN